MAKQIILTDEGLRTLEKELEFLKIVKRKEIAERIKTARDFGDLSENSEYDEAKNDQAKIENRIIEIEAMLKTASIIDESSLSVDTVSVGSTFVVLDMELNEEIKYKIVGSAEADPRKGKISDESPIGKALVGKKVGEVAVVEAPAGEIKFKVLNMIS